MEKKISKFPAENLDIEYKNFYINEGLYFCDKNLNIVSEKMESTEDGKSQSFLYIHNNGKISFTGRNIYPGFKKSLQIPKDHFDAVLFKKNKKLYLQDIQVFHSILGMDFGKGSTIRKIKIESGKIYLGSTNDTCYQYSLYQSN